MDSFYEKTNSFIVDDHDTLIQSDMVENTLEDMSPFEESIMKSEILDVPLFVEEETESSDVDAHFLVGTFDKPTSADETGTAPPSHKRPIDDVDPAVRPAKRRSSCMGSVEATSANMGTLPVQQGKQRSRSMSLIESSSEGYSLSIPSEQHELQSQYELSLQMLTLSMKRSEESRMELDRLRGAMSYFDSPSMVPSGFLHCGRNTFASGLALTRGMLNGAM